MFVPDRARRAHSRTGGCNLFTRGTNGDGTGSTPAPLARGGGGTPASGRRRGPPRPPPAARAVRRGRPPPPPRSAAAVRRRLPPPRPPPAAAVPARRLGHEHAPANLPLQPIRHRG